MAIKCAITTVKHHGILGCLREPLTAIRTFRTEMVWYGVLI